MLKKDTNEQSYDELYEEVASNHYDVNSVFNNPVFKNSTEQRTPAPRFRPVSNSRGQKKEQNFQTVILKKKKSFTRPGQESNTISKEDTFTPSFFKR